MPHRCITEAVEKEERARAMAEREAKRASKAEADRKKAEELASATRKADEEAAAKAAEREAKAAAAAEAAANGGTAAEKASGETKEIEAPVVEEASATTATVKGDSPGRRGTVMNASLKSIIKVCTTRSASSA